MPSGRGIFQAVVREWDADFGRDTCLLKEGEHEYTPRKLPSWGRDAKVTFQAADWKLAALRGMVSEPQSHLTKVVLAVRLPRGFTRDLYGR
jgi:hypothetical protein